MAAKAAPEIHAVIRDECIRLGVGRTEYRAVVKSLFNRIRNAIGWMDVKGAIFCPGWEVMKNMIHVEHETGPNKAVHTKKPDWRNSGDGCVWTEVDIYLAERLIAYRYESTCPTLSIKLTLLTLHTIGRICRLLIARI